MELLNTSCIEPAARFSKMKQAFLNRYGEEATLGARAPGRVDLMGSHTDYNQGCVMTLSIDREIWILARPRDDGRVRLASLNMGSEATFEAEDPGRERCEDWGVYPQGVAVALHGAGYRLNGCDALVHGTVPLSSGLSSSAALEAATATLFEALGNYEIDPVEKARLTQRAENQWVGVNCGILDQYSSIMGERHKTLVLDCRSLTHRYAAVPRDLKVVICNTCAPRKLTGSEYGERRAQCEQGAAFFADQYPQVEALRDVSIDCFERHEAELPQLAARRSRYVIEENARVGALAEALVRDDREAIARLMDDSFEGARDLFQISVPSMQAMMDAMHAAPGVIGCRQAGAGFGGCMVALVEKAKVSEFCEATTEAYRNASGLEPEIYPVRTAAGAGILDLG